MAADIRDQIRALEVTLEEQRVVSSDFLDQDVIGYHREGIALEIAVMSIRDGQAERQPRPTRSPGRSSPTPS